MNNKKKRQLPFYHVIGQNEDGDILNKEDEHWRQILLKSNLNLLIVNLEIVTLRYDGMASL